MKEYKVTNRSGSAVIVSVPEDHIRKEFAPGETKKMTHEELEKFSNRPGGMRIIANYLMIQDEAALKELEVPTEPEYFMTDKEITDLLLHGSQDAFLDALDFAPTGVIQIIKDLAVTLPLNDVAKREAIKEKTGFDVTKAIQHNAETKAASEKDAAAPKRRVGATQEAPAPAAPARRVTSQYKIVTPE